jgi:hypothetical protein
MEAVVPDEIRLVAAPAAEEAHGVAAGGELVALGEAPGVALPGSVVPHVPSGIRV